MTVRDLINILLDSNPDDRVKIQAHIFGSDQPKEIIELQEKHLYKMRIHGKEHDIIIDAD